MIATQLTDRSHNHQVRVFVNGQPILVPTGSSVAVAIMQAGFPLRRSVSGEPRSALCAMGICEECRATVDAVPHVRTCQRLAVESMTITAG